MFNAIFKFASQEISHQVKGTKKRLDTFAAKAIKVMDHIRLDSLNSAMSNSSIECHIVHFKIRIQ
jgi:hypothetical protein